MVRIQLQIFAFLFLAMLLSTSVRFVLAGFQFETKPAYAGYVPPITGGPSRTGGQGTRYK